MQHWNSCKSYKRSSGGAEQATAEEAGETAPKEGKVC
jgi:hypothetical protein